MYDRTSGLHYSPCDAQRSVLEYERESSLTQTYHRIASLDGIVAATMRSHPSRVANGWHLARHRREPPPLPPVDPFPGAAAAARVPPPRVGG
jgi:hypothetical protein